jgi:hypothetical protein
MSGNCWRVNSFGKFYRQNGRILNVRYSSTLAAHRLARVLAMRCATTE